MSTTEDVAHTKLQALANNSIKFQLLNALLTHAPTIGGRDVIAMDIIAASVELHGLEELTQFYKTGLLLPSKSLLLNFVSQHDHSIVRAGGKTPQVSFHPSRDPKIQTEANVIAVDLETAKQDQKMLKQYVRRCLSLPTATSNVWARLSTEMDIVVW
jgi:hypothetical protein